MANQSYIELLRDPQWQRKRLEILNRDDFTCQACAEKTKTLHVHHKRYRRGCKPWEYDGADLVTLCEDCHEATTNTKRRLVVVIEALGPGWDAALLGYAEAILSVSTDGHRIPVRDENHAQGILALALDVSAAGSALISRENVVSLAAEGGGSVHLKELVDLIQKKATETANAGEAK